MSITARAATRLNMFTLASMCDRQMAALARIYEADHGEDLDPTNLRGTEEEVEEMVVLLQGQEVESHPALEKMLNSASVCTLTDVSFDDLDANPWGGPSTSLDVGIVDNREEDKERYEESNEEKEKESREDRREAKEICERKQESQKG